MTAYQDLEKRFKRLSDIRGAEGVLHWDSATMMPPGGAEARGEQLATLSVIAHQAITDAALEALLDEAEGEAGDLGDWQSANLREMRRAWRHANAVDADLVEALSREGTACEMAWRGARADDDFAALQPKLASLLGLVREKAAAKAAAFGCSAYDALLDAYDPGTSSADIDSIFDVIRAFLPGLIREVTVRHAPAAPPLAAPLIRPNPPGRKPLTVMPSAPMSCRSSSSRCDRARSDSRTASSSGCAMDSSLSTRIMRRASGECTQSLKTKTSRTGVKNA